MAWNDIITTVGALFGSVSTAGWIFERRKRNALAESVETDNEGKNIENQAKSVELYQKMLDDLGDRYEKRFLEVEDLYQRKVKVLEDEIKLHKRVISNLKRENAELRKQLKLKRDE